MWRTRDFDEVARALKRLRGILPSGNLFEVGDSGRVEKTTKQTPASQMPADGVSAGYYL